MADRLKRSGPRHPCPACGRVKDADCAWGEEIILCHQGKDPRPTDSMRPGQTIKLKGQVWALIRTNAGHSGCADLLRPHRGGQIKFESKTERLAFERVINAAEDRLKLQRLAFLKAASVVRGHRDPYWQTLEELNECQEREEEAIAMGVTLQQETTAVKRHSRRREDTKAIAVLIKELGYQAAHTRAWRKNQLGECSWMKSST